MARASKPRWCRSRMASSSPRGAVRIPETNLHQKAIELGFGQRIGPLELDRVLRREGGEGRREPMARAVDRDLPLLHRLEQRRLRPRRHAVDLVDEQQVGEDRSLMEREGARRHVEDVGADDVGGHQVGRALHALELQAHDARERPNRQRLGEAGNAFEQRVPAADDRQQQQVDHLGLPDDDLGELATGLARDLFECAHRLSLPLAQRRSTRAASACSSATSGTACRAVRSRIASLPPARSTARSQSSHAIECQPLGRGRDQPLVVGSSSGSPSDVSSRRRTCAYTVATAAVDARARS